MLNTSGLSLDQAPPIRVPFRFFLTAPLYLLLAGLVLLIADAPLATRWTSEALAITHLVVLGFLTQIMFGALYQMIPVLAGAAVSGATILSPWAWGFLNGGTLFLSGGLLFTSPPAIAIGGVLLSICILLFVVQTAVSLLRIKSSDVTGGILSALAALIITAAFGMAIVGVLNEWWLSANFQALVDRHLTIGLLGWTGLLIVSIATQVIPMFHITPPYPPTVRRWLPVTLLTLLLAWLLLTRNGNTLAQLLWVLVLGYTVFAVLSLWILLRRKRKIPDATFSYWLLGFTSSGLAAGSWLLAQPPVLTGTLLLTGVAICLPSGMLLKITPFLSWFHLQGQLIATGRMDIRLPKMHDFIPSRSARWQFWGHVATVAVLVLVVRFPLIPTWTGALLLIASTLLLWSNLLRAVWRYREIAVTLAPEKTVNSE